MVETLKKILICDDHPIVHTGIKYALKEIFPNVGFDISCTTSGSESLSKLEANQPDIFFLDLSLPDMTGFDVLKYLEKKDHHFKIIILTGENSLPTFLQLTKFNISAILLKSYSNDSFKKAFAHIEAHEPFIYLDEALELDLKAEAGKRQLSSKEFEVLCLVVKGYSNKKIAHVLECSPETVKSHLASIARKTNIDNRDDLISWFYEGREK
ncbi:hypothetical protein C0V70_16610 [Bacteriovorax stolpii]|uniref:Uncharacterized protein n=1 Tax=Bacteriovorax stolpii TaxID=960 RepID=A0A2K9NW04_BACTC|nr:response regulator transcription factor [Bacteriovorax stolpii]AUN99698.1 hypothetical protein C0V70_16610 [Bacteriovorax stolpii]TDP51332.1 LuxR family two component transcriptional regulator [Bacteriovorax stolpii]